MEYLRTLTEAEHALHVDRLQRVRLGNDFIVGDNDPEEILQVLEELLEKEISLLSPNGLRCDYESGTARAADEIHTTTYGRAALISSEHATRHWTFDHDTGAKTPKPSEPGTAALGSMAATVIGGTHISMIGRQTGNPNYEPYHPYKKHLQRLIGADTYGAFFSLHGMQSGLVSDLCDERPYDLLIGTGNNPNVASQITAQNLVRVAGKLGLRAAVNAPFLDIVRGEDGKYRQRVYKDGTPMTKVFVAPDYTTRATAQRAADAAHHNMPALQIELAGGLRILPWVPLRRDGHVRVGPYFGWKALLQIISTLPCNFNEKNLEEELTERSLQPMRG